MNLEDKLKNIKLVITDVDGVLTDGSLIYDANGEALKCFNVRDGLGIRLLIENGVQVAVLSGRDSAVLRKRISDLKIEHFLLGKLEKESACLQLMQEVGVEAEETAFIGDDSVDLPAFATCGLSFAVADAMEYVKNAANYILTLPGGKGAFREVADQILRAQDKADSFESAKGFLKTANKMAQ